MVSYSKEFQNRAWDTRRSKRFCHQRYASCKRFTFCQICICDETFVYYADRDACDFMPKISSSTTANPTPTPTPTSAEKRATAMTETSTVATTDRSYNGTSARTAEKKSSSRTLRRSTTKPVTKLSSLSREYTTAYSSTAAVHASSTKPSSQNGGFTSTNAPLKTTVLPGDNKTAVSSKSSNVGLIIGLCLASLVLICIAVVLYLRRKRSRPRKMNGLEANNRRMNLPDLKSSPQVESPTSPGYDYVYAGPSSCAAKGRMTNAGYHANLHVSEPFYSDLAPRQESQPVYLDLIREQVYMDPNTTGSVQGEQQTCKELEKPVSLDTAASSPIYREVEDPPVYAETDETRNRAVGTEPQQYQELNYASTKNVYQPLSDDWKSKKYNR